MELNFRNLLNKSSSEYHTKEVTLPKYRLNIVFQKKKNELVFTVDLYKKFVLHGWWYDTHFHYSIDLQHPIQTVIKGYNLTIYPTSA